MQSLDDLYGTNRPIKSPNPNPIASRHAEEDIFNGIAQQIDNFGLTASQLNGRTVNIHISNAGGVCNVCYQGLGNSTATPGVIRQFSERYPGLNVRITAKGGTVRPGVDSITVRGGRLLTDWSNFLQEDESDQARFLLDTAMSAWNKVHEPEDIVRQVRDYLTLGYEVLDGRFDKLPQLIRFIEDPDMEHDFGAFFERIQHNETASAALDLASYACGFVSRTAANASGYSPLPDPVLESLPEIYEYYQGRASLLGV